MNLVATQRLQYGTRMFEAGARFAAEQPYAGILISLGRAELAPEQDELPALRAEYERIACKPADRRWGVGRLQAEIKVASR